LHDWLLQKGKYDILKISSNNRVVGGNMKKKKISLLLIILLLIFPVTAAFASGLWPGDSSAVHQWYAYAFSDGTLIYDPADESPANSDIISVAGSHPSVYVASDGVNLFFRMRLRGDPRSSGRYASQFWIVEIAAQNSAGNFVHTATVGLKGGNPSSIYVAPAYGAVLTTVYDNITTSSPYVRTTETNDGYAHYFLDFQVPIASINAVSGNGAPVITGTTPVKLFYGTSTNPVHIGKDYMTGTEVNFDGVIQIKPDDPADTLAPVLTVDKTGPASVSAGDQIVYSLAVRNLGPGNATNVKIEDILPSDIENAEYSLNNSNSWQTWNGTRILPEFLADPGINNILIRGTLKSNASGTLSNTVTVSSSSSKTVSDTVNTTISSESDVSIVKTLSNTEAISAGDLVNYSIVVRNSGPSDAHNVTITDLVPAVITNPEYYDGSSWQNWAGSLNIGTLVNGASYTLSLRGTVDISAVESVSNTASVSSDSTDDSSGNNSSTITTMLDQSADVSIALNCPTEVIAGGTAQYTITVTNNESVITATGVRVSNIVSGYLSGPQYSIDGGNIWNTWLDGLDIGDMVPGASITILVRGIVPSSAPASTCTNSADVSGTLPDTDLSNQFVTNDIDIKRQSDVKIEKRLLTNPNNITAGSLIEYEILYSNDGFSDADNVTITDTLPTGIKNVEASRCRSAFGPWNGSINVGTVVAGGECSLVIRGVVTSDFTSVLNNTATISSDSIETDASNNTSSLQTPVKAVADLNLTKAASVTTISAGETFSYTITLDNYGPSDAINVRVQDILPDGISFIGASSTVGVWNAPYWKIDRLSSGETAVLLLTVKVNDSFYAQKITNTAAVASDTDDINTNNNSDSVQTSANLPQTGQELTLFYVLFGLSTTLLVALILFGRLTKKNA
jgi:uncharacterized repeat protein (TIGR01451 family)/LPXTG-motif cell wall-anchored protein